MDEEIMLSALQYFTFCPRQYALVHIDQAWAENAQTMLGSQLHNHVHSNGAETRDGVRILTALPLVSLQYGITGVADAVEFLADGSVRPVEYKSGKAKPHLADEVQLCAQALCLEEMFKLSIPSGFIYHIASKKRREVVFTPELRQAVLIACDGIKKFLKSGMLPPPAADERCYLCSLIDDYDCEPFAAREFPPDYNPFDTRLRP